jgi:Arc/MetJ-type ribon-helix-helix transcriptional regulator
LEIDLRPEIERFVDEQVAGGRFATTNQLMEEALSCMMTELTDLLNDDALDAIDDSERQIERGEYRNWDEVAAEIREQVRSK